MIQRYQKLLNDCIDLQESIMFRQMQKKLENLRKGGKKDENISWKFNNKSTGV